MLNGAGWNKSWRLLEYHPISGQNQHTFLVIVNLMPRAVADACMRHGYCTAELIIWYITKQLVLPPDLNGHHAEGDSSYTHKSATVYAGSSLEMVGRDAAPAQLMR